MFPRLAAPACSKTATKRIAIYCGCLCLSFLAALLFVLPGGLQVPRSNLAERGLSAAHTPIQPRLVTSYGKLPLSFEVNQGQAHPQVKFLARGRGYTLFLTGDEAVLRLRSQESEVRSQKPEVRTTYQGLRVGNRRT